MANFTKSDTYSLSGLTTGDPVQWTQYVYEETAGGSHFTIGWSFIEEYAVRGGNPMKLLDIYYQTTYYDPPPAHPVSFEVSGYGTTGSDENLIEGFWLWHGGQTHRSYIFYQFELDNPFGREMRGCADGYRVVSPFTGINMVAAGSATGTSADPSTTTSSLPANCLIVAGIAHAYRNYPTAGSGFIQSVPYDAGNWTFSTEYMLDSGAAGTKTVSFTCPADNWGLIWMAFEATSGAGIAPLATDHRRRRI